MSSNFWLDLLILTLVWAGIAGSWNLLAGFAGQFSLGHAAFIGIGAYVPALLVLRLGIAPLLGIVAGAVVAGCFAFVVAAVSLRTRGPFFSLMTIAFAEVTKILAIYLKPLTNGSEGLTLALAPGLPNLLFVDKGPYVAISSVYAFAVFGLSFWLRRSRLGYRVLAVRDDENAAQSLGVPPFFLRLVAAIMSASGAAIGGTILAFYTQFIDPDSTLSFTLSIEAALIAIVGGLGDPLGPLFGAILVVPLEHLTRGWFGGLLSGLDGLIFGILLIAILLTLPDGLVDGWRRWGYRRMRRRYA
jgi:branched-chain amino acid transport system permease protein